MRWPWSSTPDHDTTTTPLSWTSLADWQQRFRDPANLVPSVLATATALGAVAFYKTYLRRIPTVDHIKPKAFRQRSVFGQVTRVGDADNFHLFHTPGGRLAGWGWMPGRRVPEEKKELRARTIHIRIAGVDAPELAHFGRPEQPFAEEAFQFLTEYIHNRRVRAYIYRRDQYDRVVASVFIRRWLVRKDVGLEMLKRGLATVYEAKSGSEFGVWEEKYREAEAQAKRAKVGMWREPGLLERVLGEKKRVAESPRDYKTRMAALEKNKEGNGNGKGNGKK